MQKRSMSRWLAAVLVLLATGVTPAFAQVEVPKLLGMTGAEAAAELGTLDLQPDGPTSDARIYWQSITTGTDVPVNTTVRYRTLTDVAVPPIDGKRLSAYQDTLLESGLHIKADSWLFSVLAVDETEPPPSTIVPLGSVVQVAIRPPFGLLFGALAGWLVGLLGLAWVAALMRRLSQLKKKLSDLKEKLGQLQSDQSKISGATEAPGSSEHPGPD